MTWNWNGAVPTAVQLSTCPDADVGEPKLNGELATHENPTDPERDINSLPREGVLNWGVNATDKVTCVAAVATLLKDKVG